MTNIYIKTIKNIFKFIHHNQIYSGIPYFFILIIFGFNIVCIFIPSLCFDSYYFLTEVLFLVSMIFLLLYGGILYCFTGMKNQEIGSELINLLLCIYGMVFLSFIALGYKADLFWGQRLFFFNNYYCLDFWNYMEKIWIIFFSTFSAVLAKPLLKANPYNMVEFPALLGFSSFLLCVFVSLYDIFAMFVVIESLFFLFLCLSVFNFAKFTIESCIKYFIQNVFVAGLSGFGIFIIYFICQSANLFIIKESVRFFMELNYWGILVDWHKPYFYLLLLGIGLFLISILFKIGVFPFHFYVADIYECSPYPVIFFFSSVVKPIFLFFFMKFIYFLFSPAVYTYVFFNYFVIIGIGSMFIGTLGALYQTNVKRFLGYTSINQFGFLLLAYIETWSSNSSIFFIVIYSFLYSLSIFPFFYIMSVFGDRKSKLGSVTNFSDFNYFYSYSFKYVIVLSFVFISGLPPFLLFFYKYYLLLNIFHTSNYLVVLYIILLSVLNLVYYLKIIKSVLFEGGAGNKKVLLITSSNKFSENYIDINRISTFLESFYLGFLIINFLLFFSFDFLYSDACARIIECLSPRGYFYIQI